MYCVGLYVILHPNHLLHLSDCSLPSVVKYQVTAPDVTCTGEEASQLVGREMCPVGQWYCLPSLFPLLGCDLERWAKSRELSSNPVLSLVLGVKLNFGQVCSPYVAPVHSGL